MLITIIFVVLIVIGIGLVHLYNHTNCGDWAEITGGTVAVIASICLVICVIIVMVAQIGKPVAIEKALTEYETLTYELEKFNEDDYTLTSSINFDLLPRISKYNGYVRASKYLTSNPWVNWFYVDYYNYVPLIDLSEGA